MAWVDPGGFFPGDPRVVAAVRAAAGPLDEVRMPGDTAAALRDVYVTVQGCEAAAVHADRIANAPDLYDPEILERLRAAAEIPGWRYVQAMESRAALAAIADALFDDHDVLALPTVPITAPPIGAREIEIDGRSLPVRPALLALTSPWNVLGYPALTVPAGTVDGLPVGLQFVCRPGREALLFDGAGRPGAR